MSRCIDRCFGRADEGQAGRYFLTMVFLGTPLLVQWWTLRLFMPLFRERRTWWAATSILHNTYRFDARALERRAVYSHVAYRTLPAMLTGHYLVATSTFAAAIMIDGHIAKPNFRKQSFTAATNIDRAVATIRCAIRLEQNVGLLENATFNPMRISLAGSVAFLPQATPSTAEV